MIKKFLKKNYQYLIHPILFGLYPLIYLYSENFAEISINELLTPFVMLLGLTVVLLVISMIISRQISKSSFLVSLFLFIFLYYTKLFIGVIENIWSISQNLFLSFSLIFYLICSYLLITTKKNLSVINLYINIIALSFYLVAFINITLEVYDIYKVNRAIKQIEIKKTNNNFTYEKKSEKKDIYYFIFDQYARQDVLKKHYGFDNSHFIKYLESKGFYITENSYSNYPHTRHSVAATLNMQYLNYLTEQQGKNNKYPTALHRLISRNKVTKYLKSKGYKYIHIGHYSVHPKLIDININDEFNNYYRKINDERSILQILYDQTMLPVIMTRINKKYTLISKIVYDARLNKRRKIFYMFDKISEIPEIKEPTFTFLHLLIPHDPYVVDKDGNLVTFKQQEQNTIDNNYLGQLQFVNNKLMEVIEILLNGSDSKPIIIIQSDEGSWPKGYDYYKSDISDYSKEQLRHKFAIINAFYLPDVDTKVLYSSITPVNTFPLVFNLYFSEDFELLPDKHFHSNYFYYYRFLDVTDIIKNN